MSELPYHDRGVQTSRRSTQVHHRLSSPYGYGWHCLPAPKRPGELTVPAPTLVWIPLIEAASRFGVTPNALYNRVRKGQLETQRRSTRLANGKQVLVTYLREDQLATRKRYSRAG